MIRLPKSDAVALKQAPADAMIETLRSVCSRTHFVERLDGAIHAVMRYAEFDSLESSTDRLHSQGWFIGGTWEEDDDGWMDVLVEPRFTATAKDLPRFLQHATPIENLPSILVNGLVAATGRRNQFSHIPPRVYTAASASALDMFLDICTRRHGFREVVVLDVDRTALEEDVHFHMDPQTKDGCFTYGRVGPNALAVRESLSLDPSASKFAPGSLRL